MQDKANTASMLQMSSFSYNYHGAILHSRARVF
jgi:hypothetical protein